MKKDQTEPEKSHPYSELLEGTRPTNDARLVRDIMNAGKNDEESLMPGPSKSPKPQIVIIKHIPTHHIDPTSTNGATTWDSSS